MLPEQDANEDLRSHRRDCDHQVLPKGRVGETRPSRVADDSCAAWPHEVNAMMHMAMHPNGDAAAVRQRREIGCGIPRRPAGAMCLR